MDAMKMNWRWKSERYRRRTKVFFFCWIRWKGRKNEALRWESPERWSKFEIRRRIVIKGWVYGCRQTATGRMIVHRQLATHSNFPGFFSVLFFRYLIGTNNNQVIQWWNESSRTSRVHFQIHYLDRSLRRCRSCRSERSLVSVCLLWISPVGIG